MSSFALEGTWREHLVVTYYAYRITGFRNWTCSPMNYDIFKCSGSSITFVPADMYATLLGLEAFFIPIPNFIELIFPSFMHLWSTETHVIYNDFTGSPGKQIGIRKIQWLDFNYVNFPTTDYYWIKQGNIKLLSAIDRIKLVFDTLYIV